MNEEQARWYLAAMIDGEGHVGLHVYEKNRGTKRSVYHRRLSITNQDEVLIEACREACDLLGIRHNVYVDMNRPKPLYALVVTNRDGFERAAELPIRSPKKLQAFEDILASYVNARRTPPRRLDARRPEESAA